MGILANEWIKIFKKKATYIMIGMVLLLTLVTAIVILVTGDSEDTQNANWKTELQDSNKQLELDLESSPPKAIQDSYKEEIAANNYRIEHDMNPNGTYNVLGFMDDSVGFLSLIALFTIIIAAGMVASEFSGGTIKLLLIRPINRVKILLSKYIAVLLFALFMLVFLFVISFLFGSIFFGFEGTQPHLAFVNGEIIERNMILYLIFQYGIHSVDLLMYTTMAFMISAAFRNSSLAIGLAIFLLLSGDLITLILASVFDGAKYLLFANLNLAQYFDGTPLMEGMTLTFSISVLSVYFIAFIGVSFLAFVKRDVAA